MLQEQMISLHRINDGMIISGMRAKTSTRQDATRNEDARMRLIYQVENANLHIRELILMIVALMLFLVVLILGYLLYIKHQDITRLAQLAQINPSGIWRFYFNSNPNDQ